MLRVYIMAPYSATTAVEVERNVMAAEHAANELLDHDCAPYCPHLSHYLELRKPRPYEDWIRFCFQWLRQCDVALRLPGVSPGAEREVAECHRVNIPVYYSLRQLLDREGLR